MEEIEPKEKILKGAEGLFMKYGIRSITMDDIARQLGVSKKTLYQHFADKDDIVTQVCTQHMQNTLNQFEDILKSSENAVEELAKLSMCLKQNMEETNPSLLFDLQKYHPRAWAFWMEFKQKNIYDSVKRNVDRGIGEGFYRPELNAEIISILRMTMIEAAFDDRSFPHGKFKLSDVQMQVFDHFVYGIVTEKGKKLYQKYKLQNLQPSTIL
jgi:TetR/AcrR family transcriptional regulator, cholesterol catabolism regulator